jgi:hypothetical protein
MMQRRLDNFIGRSSNKQTCQVIIRRGMRKDRGGIATLYSALFRISHWARSGETPLLQIIWIDA